MKSDIFVEMLRAQISKQAREIEELSRKLIEKDSEIATYKRLAMINPVSEIYSENYLNEEIKRITAIKDRFMRKNPTSTIPTEYVCMVFIDVNNLKMINNTYGHSAGNAAIKKTGQVLNENVRRGDIAVHLHGDEFVVITITNKRSEGLAMKKRIMEAVKIMFLEDLEISFSASVGYQGTALNPNFSFQKLKDKADFKMYKQKRNR